MVPFGDSLLDSLEIKWYADIAPNEIIIWQVKVYPTKG